MNRWWQEKKNRNLLLTAAPLGDPNGDGAADATQTAVNTIIIMYRRFFWSTCNCIVVRRSVVRWRYDTRTLGVLGHTQSRVLNANNNNKYTHDENNNINIIRLDLVYVCVPSWYSIYNVMRRCVYRYRGGHLRASWAPSHLIGRGRGRSQASVSYINRPFAFFSVFSYLLHSNHIIRYNMYITCNLRAILCLKRE